MGLFPSLMGGLGWVFLLLLSSCAIKDDIPFPIVEGAITAFEVEGQCDAEGNEGGMAEINLDNRTVKVFVNDLVDVANLKVKRIEVSNDAAVIKDSLLYKGSEIYPTKQYAQGGSMDNLRANFSEEATFTLRTWQEYEWKVSVEQIIHREVQLENQVGAAVIDPINRNVVVYVSKQQKLDEVHVLKMSIGGLHGTVAPDPTNSPVFDFRHPVSFLVQYGWGGVAERWQVFVYQTDAQVATTATAFIRSVSVTLTGDKPNDTMPLVTFRRQGNETWETLPNTQISSTSVRYEAEISGLQPGITYEYQVSAGNSSSGIQTFTTIGSIPLENGGFDNWCVSGTGNQSLYQPWGEGQESYWDTGNRGATTVGASNSTYIDEDGRRFANLQSKYIVLKFAAGNIFTGKYVETSGTNGILSFGRPFNAFPTKLRFDYKYKTSVINRTGGEWKDSYKRYISRQLYEGLKGQPDSCQVYIALGDWEPIIYKGEVCPVFIRTRPSELSLFDLNDEHLIAYAQMTKGEDVSQWTTETLNLDYRVKNRQPKYIIVVASSSKYGDYFTGGEGSLLQVDNMELLYE